jgi:apolipoprotein N-acyltransferase
MKKLHLLLLSALSGVLFTIGWPVNGFPAFLFTAFIPLLIIEEYILKNRQDFSRYSVFFYTYPAFLIWNIATTWWVWNSTPAAVAAWTLNALFMSTVMNVFHLSRRYLFQNRQGGYFILAFYWIAFEYLHLNWAITWPWLNLGNGFATYYQWIQWYEYTGTMGGTFWIIAINILIYKIIKQVTSPANNKYKFIWNSSLALFLLVVPIGYSYFSYYSYEEENRPVNIIVVQPNLDPYSEQYTTPPLEVVDINFNLAKEIMDSTTTIIACPESTLQENIWEGRIEQSASLNKLKLLIKQYPNLNIIIGASTFKRYFDETSISKTARYHEKGEFYYDNFNTAFLISNNDSIRKHHKSKLTPGVEYMPQWGFIGKIAIDLGGSTGSLGTDKVQKPFVINDSIRIAPIICYESVFGEYCTRFIDKGAQAFCLITNDGWWGNTPGYKQHLTFSSLRAIEMRRSIARSANTGTSAFINQRGDISQPTEYWVPDAIKESINLSDKVTFYSTFGNYFGRISAFISVTFILLTFVFRIRNRKQLGNN